MFTNDVKLSRGKGSDPVMKSMVSQGGVPRGGGPADFSIWGGGPRGEGGPTPKIFGAFGADFNIIMCPDRTF